MIPQTITNHDEAKQAFTQILADWSSQKNISEDKFNAYYKSHESLERIFKHLEDINDFQKKIEGKFQWTNRLNELFRLGQKTQPTDKKVRDALCNLYEFIRFARFDPISCKAIFHRNVDEWNDLRKDAKIHANISNILLKIDKDDIDKIIDHMSNLKEGKRQLSKLYRKAEISIEDYVNIPNSADKDVGGFEI